MTKTTTQLDRIARVLSENTTQPGITPAATAKAAKVPRASVSKRVAELRADGMKITTNYRTVNGRRKAYYQLAS